MRSEEVYKHFINRTVKSVEVIHAEYGRTYNQYICFVFTDGEKVMLDGGVPYDPNPPVEEMKKAPNYFSPQMIADRVLRDEQEKRRREDNKRAEKMRELERLKKDLGES